MELAGFTSNFEASLARVRVTVHVDPWQAEQLSMPGHNLHVTHSIELRAINWA